MSDGPVFWWLDDLLRDPSLLEPPPALLPRFAYAGMVTALAGPPKVGKTDLIAQGVADYSQGRAFLDELTAAGKTLWVALDEGLATTVRRLMGFGADPAKVLLTTERWPFAQLEQVVTDFGVRLVVVDTISELAAGQVEDANASTQWQPIYSALRGLAQRAEVAVVLIDHSPKANPHSLVGSLAKMAGCDLILTMTTSDTSPTTRHVRARGRLTCSDFSTFWDGERHGLCSGELTLETRVYHRIVASPDCSLTALRDAVGGKAKAVDEAVQALVRRGLIEDTGNGRGHRFRRRSENAGTGPGQDWDRPPLDLLSDAGHGGDRVGTGLGTGARPPTPTGWVGDRVRPGTPSDEDFERDAIASEGA